LANFKNKEGLISVVIPIHNASLFIHKAIESILEQTYKNIELILVNDGSTDNSIKILNVFKRKYKKIILISQKNQGAGIARNVGLDKASGEFIMFLDQDDYLEKNALKKLKKSIRNKKYNFVCFGANFFKKNGNLEACLTYEEKEIVGKNILRDYFLGKNIKMVVWNKFYRAEFLDNFNIRFDKNSGAEEALFTLKACFHADYILLNPGIFYNHTKNNPESFTNKMDISLYKDLIKVLDLQKNFLIENNKFIEFKDYFYIYIAKHLTHVMYSGIFCKKSYINFMECSNVFFNSSYWKEINTFGIKKFYFSLRLRIYICRFPRFLWFFGSFLGRYK
jgi:glycosyltransferase involved in cell wall biosynthesis